MVEVCPNCDISGCTHIRNRTGAFAPMNNPEQDADRAAFEHAKERDFRLWLPLQNGNVGQESYEPWSSGYEAAWQAAKADSRAMQDAFEQVCAALDKACHAQYCVYHPPGDMYNKGSGLPCNCGKNKALSLAAPFRKTGA